MPTEVTAQVRQNSLALPEGLAIQRTERSADSDSQNQKQTRQNLQLAEKNLPPTTLPTERENSLTDSELGQAVSDLNNVVQNLQRELNFNIDEESGRTIVKVIDSENGELIRQIPSEQIVKLAESIEARSGLLLDATV